MTSLSIIGIDLAKNSIQIYGTDSTGKKTVCKAISRKKVVEYFANIPPCLIGMEACATSAYWQRTLEELGHTVKRIHPVFVVPFRIGDKNDANDARALWEAVQRPHLRSVPAKSQEQSDIQAVHRVRANLVKTRTATLNQARGLLAENGLVVPKGPRHIMRMLVESISDEHNELSGIMKRVLKTVYELLNTLEAQIHETTLQLTSIARSCEPCVRLQKIPGVGVITATMLYSVAGRAQDFKNGRQFAAYLGLVPREHSTGGKHKLLGISKRGDGYIRSLLVTGAQSCIRSLGYPGSRVGECRLREWLQEVKTRRGVNTAAVALANRTARTAFSMLKNGTSYSATH